MGNNLVKKLRETIEITGRKTILEEELQRVSQEIDSGKFKLRIEDVIKTEGNTKIILQDNLHTDLSYFIPTLASTYKYLNSINSGTPLIEGNIDLHKNENWIVRGYSTGGFSREGGDFFDSNDSSGDWVPPRIHLYCPECRIEGKKITMSGSTNPKEDIAELKDWIGDISIIYYAPILTDIRKLQQQEFEIRTAKRELAEERQDNKRLYKAAKKLINHQL